MPWQHNNDNVVYLRGSETDVFPRALHQRMSDSAFSSRQIAELRSMLEAEKIRLESLLSHGEADTKPVTLDQQSVGRVSRIDAIQQQQMAIASKAQASRLLQRIELALQRIDDGEYGYCSQCGESIRFARLQAQPDASMCLACQSKTESG